MSRRRHYAARPSTLRDQLLEVADRYAVAKKVSRARVSTLILNQGMKLDQIAQGHDLMTGKFEDAMLWLSRNWPNNADWPAGIARPLGVSPQTVPALPVVHTMHTINSLPVRMRRNRRAGLHS